MATLQMSRKCCHIPMIPSFPFAVRVIAERGETHTLSKKRSSFQCINISISKIDRLAEINVMNIILQVHSKMIGHFWFLCKWKMVTFWPFCPTYGVKSARVRGEKGHLWIMIESMIITWDILFIVFVNLKNCSNFNLILNMRKKLTLDELCLTFSWSGVGTRSLCLKLPYRSGNEC